MPVESTSVLSKLQNKMPTSMRYERVQDILENELALRGRLSARTVPVETRFSEKVYFSEETIKITQALHAEGKDAHKVPKHEILMMAAKVMRVIPGNGEARPSIPPPAQAAVSISPPPAPPPPPPAQEKRKVQTVIKSKPAAKRPAKAKAVKKVEAKPPAAKTAHKHKTKVKRKAKVTPIPTPESVPTAKKSKAKATPKVQKPKTEGTKPKTESKPESKPETKPKGSTPAPAVAVAEEPIPESELPPERQPLRLPPNFDPRNHPHYSVQSSIYSLLLSALAMSEAYEKFPGLEERQHDLGSIVKKYQDTCDPLKQMELAERT